LHHILGSCLDAALRFIFDGPTIRGIGKAKQDLSEKPHEIPANTARAMRVQRAHEGPHLCGTLSLIGAHDWCSQSPIYVRHWLTNNGSLFSFLLRLKSGQDRGCQPAAGVQQRGQRGQRGSEQPGPTRPSLRSMERISYPHPVPHPVLAVGGIFKSGYENGLNCRLIAMVGCLTVFGLLLDDSLARAFSFPQLRMHETRSKVTQGL
jgi:hypothetical protein